LEAAMPIDHANDDKNELKDIRFSLELIENVEKNELLVPVPLEQV